MAKVIITIEDAPEGADAVANINFSTEWREADGESHAVDLAAGILHLLDVIREGVDKDQKVGGTD
jgi:hypothetical protein